MKFIKFLFTGVLFGIIMTKSEVISWFRIQEMFRFQSFHMYGIIIIAVLVMTIVTYLVKKYNIKALDSSPIAFHDKNKSVPRYLFGGIIFGMGWALSGACPGPIYTLIGNGYLAIIVVLISALAGTLLYGSLRTKLPH